MEFREYQSFCLECLGEANDARIATYCVVRNRTETHIEECDRVLGRVHTVFKLPLAHVPQAWVVVVEGVAADANARAEADEQYGEGDPEDK